MTKDDDVRFGDLRSFGRRRGRKLSGRQERLMSELLPSVSVDPDQEYNVHALFGEGVADVWLEIGFGGAEHLLWQAKANPGVGLIGCEPFEEGVVKALTGIADGGLQNVRLYSDDARAILRWLPEGALARVFVLFPDPWPKVRHRKRRLITPGFVDLVARVLRSGGELRFATDIGDYARTALEALAHDDRLVWKASGPQDWRARPDDWPQTRYEAKAIREGRPRYFFRFLRR